MSKSKTNMNNKQNISFEDILREYENKSKERKQNQRMKKLANIEENKISSFVIEGISEFKKLINQIKDEAKRRRNK
jgi:hypothetical protein